MSRSKLLQVSRRLPGIEASCSSRSTASTQPTQRQALPQQVAAGAPAVPHIAPSPLLPTLPHAPRRALCPAGLLGSATVGAPCGRGRDATSHNVHTSIAAGTETRPRGLHTSPGVDQEACTSSPVLVGAEGVMSLPAHMGAGHVATPGTLAVVVRGMHTSGVVGQDATSAAIPADPPGTSRIQGLLHHYRRNLGAVGTAISQISHHLLHGPVPAMDDTPPPDQATPDHPVLPPPPLTDANLQALADAVSTLVDQGRRPPDAYLRTAAVQFQQLLVREFDDRAVARFLEALALFGYQPSPSQVDAAAAAIGANLQACSAGSISKMLAALAVFGHTQRPLLGRVADAVVERVHEFQPIALVDILYAYAMLGNRSERLISAVLQAVLADLNRLPRASLTQVVCALAMLGHKDVVADVFLSAASDEILKAISDFSGHQLSEILWAYTQMEQWGVADTDLMEGIIYKMLSIHKELDGKDLVNLVRALAVSQHQSPRTASLLAAVVQDLVEWVPRLNAERLARLLWALASLHYYDAPLYGAVARETAARLDSFRPDHLTSLLMAWATLVHDPGSEVLDPLVGRLSAQIPGMRARSICGMMWALAVLRRLPPTLFAAACAQLARRPLACFEHPDFERLQSAEMLLAAEVGAGTPGLPDWIKTYAESAWKDKAAIEQLPSSCHVEVRNSLRDIGTLTPLPLSAEVAPTPDFIFTNARGRRLAVRVVVPLATTANPPFRELAPSVITTRLLKADGWTVVKVEKRRWMACANAAAKMAYLQGLLDDSALDSLPDLRADNPDPRDATLHLSL